MSSSTTTSETPAVGFKPKKSVALSGVTAGNTALCTVGRSGNDLHYRGYDILDLADQTEFEEVAYLLIHGQLPNAAELKGYKEKLRRLRGLPVPVRQALEALPAASHPMDVLRTGITSATRVSGSRWRRTTIPSAATFCTCCTGASRPRRGSRRCTCR
jgi:2-methylcitrate synthase